MRWVWASRPQAQVIVSNATALTLVAPPKPFQRAIGTMHSRPLASASSASLRLLSQLASQRSGSLVNASPPEQFDPNRPSLSALPSRTLLFRSVTLIVADSRRNGDG